MVLSPSIPWPIRFGNCFGGGGVVLVVIVLSIFNDAVNQAVLFRNVRFTGCPYMPVADM